MSIDRQTEILEDVLRKERIKITTNDHFLAKSVEFSTEQTATEFIEAPGEGYRIVVKYIALRTDSLSGTMHYNGTYNSAAKTFGIVYVSAFEAFSTGNLSLPLDENTAITVTTATGTSNVFAAMQYIIETV